MGVSEDNAIAYTPAGRIMQAFSFLNHHLVQLVEGGGGSLHQGLVQDMAQNWPHTHTLATCNTKDSLF